MIESLDDFQQVFRCKIGSPYVVEAMDRAGLAGVVGFEANGGFLLGYAAQGPAGALPALPTRDAFLPLIAPLAAARAKGCTLRDLVQGLPARVTAADRLAAIAPAQSQTLLARLLGCPSERAVLLGQIGLKGCARIDAADGLRMICPDGDILHLRPSGNAPELRIYVEAQTEPRAEEILQRARAVIGAMLHPAKGQGR